MTHGIKENITYGSALLMLVFGVALTTAGFLTAPVGEIHDSVLYVLGQCLLFAGSVMGVGAYTAGKVHEMQHSIDRRFRAYERHHCGDDADLLDKEDVADSQDVADGEDLQNK